VPNNDWRSAMPARSGRERVRPALTSEPGGRRSALYIVASPRPQVGKTFAARLIADFLRVEHRAMRAFDLNPHGEALRDYLPVATTAADIGDTRGQVALFDRLIADDGVAKVVDVGHAAFERFFAIAEEIELFAEARRRAIVPLVLFAADPHPIAATAYAELQRRLRDVVLIAVLNEGILKGRKVREQFPFTRAAAVPLQLPALAPLLKRQMDDAACSFADLNDRLPAAIPVALGYELQAWTRRAFVELREIDLRLLLEELRPSLQQRADDTAAVPRAERR